jgi:hypothetical protein
MGKKPQFLKWYYMSGEQFMLITNQIKAETFPDGVPIRSKWIRVSQALAWYPLRRQALYDAIRDGKIKSFSLRNPGATRGIRLLCRDSLDAFLEQEAQRAFAEQEAARCSA